jgi:hypothetical protein
MLIHDCVTINLTPLKSFYLLILVIHITFNAVCIVSTSRMEEVKGSKHELVKF